MEKISYKIYVLGCKVNAYDAGVLEKELIARGARPLINGADLAIIHSCSVTKTAMAKNRQTIKKARRENPGAKIVLAGCWPRLSGQGAETAEVDFMLGGDDKRLLWSFLDNIKVKESEKIVATKIAKKTRYTIKIQDGCEQFCAYCIIPYVRGPLRSRSREEVLAEITEAIKSGYEEIVLSGIHIGLYGYGGDYRLADLLAEILVLPGLGRIRLSSIEVGEVNACIISLIRDNPKFCKHLHIPLQSGCDKILLAMNRPYRLKDFENKIKEIRAAVPDIAISTDIITGFPGENEADFEVGLAFAQAMAFSRLHVFPFSAHPRTPAYTMPEPVDPKQKRIRAERLRALSLELEAEFRQKFVGKELLVLLENLKNGRAKMKTEYYFDVECSAKDFKASELGKLQNIRL